MLEFLQDYLASRIAEGLTSDAKQVMSLISDLLDGATDEEIWASLDATSYEQISTSYTNYINN